MRAFWILFGVATHALFAWTVCRLFPFLKGRDPIAGPFSAQMFSGGAMLVNASLALQFAVIHSWLLLPRTRERLTRYLPSALYGCVFCVLTCLSLLITIEAWQHSPVVLWQLGGYGRLVVRVGFLLSWVALFYSLSLTGVGYQTGWTPWWAWVRGRSLKRGWPEPSGAYRLFRHPIYASFLGLVWLTPTMSLDRAMLVALWTVYIFVGSHLKDRRLVHYVGQAYQRYQARVPGYPFVQFGPLGKVPMPKTEVPEIRRAA
jgi:protein-S-isoprenylcysteine O-methyltransferase Ste14